MSSWVFLPAWLSRITWSTFDSSNLRSRSRIVSGEPMSPPTCCFSPGGRVAEREVLLPQADLARARPAAWVA